MKKFYTVTLSILLAICLVSPVLSATYDDYVSEGGNSKLSQSAYDPGPNARVLFIEARAFDFSSTSFNSGSGVTHNDVVKLLDIPKDTYIVGIGFRNLRACQSGTSAEMGDGADIDGYIGNTNTSEVQYLDFSAVMSGMSIWQAGDLQGGFISGVSMSGGYGSEYTSNHGAYFTGGGGVSCYQSPDTLDMTFYVGNGLEASSGVTPHFELMVWGFKRPTY